MEDNDIPFYMTKGNGLHKFCKDYKSKAYKSFPMMYYLSYLSNMGFRGGGGQIAPPPIISWFSSTPAGIGLIYIQCPNLMNIMYC